MGHLEGPGDFVNKLLMGITGATISYVYWDSLLLRNVEF